jgi:hypothetical protein
VASVVPSRFKNVLSCLLATLLLKSNTLLVKGTSTGVPIANVVSRRLGKLLRFCLLDLLWKSRTLLVNGTGAGAPEAKVVSSKLGKEKLGFWPNLYREEK